METESQALCDLVGAKLLGRPFGITLDCHSGFGTVDCIWFPYAHTARPISRLPEVHALSEIFDDSHAHHRDVLEPQSHQYLTHGDLWDHLCLRACETPERTFLPLTFEMGSQLPAAARPAAVEQRPCARANGSRSHHAAPTRGRVSAGRTRVELRQANWRCTQSAVCGREAGNTDRRAVAQFADGSTTRSVILRDAICRPYFGLLSKSLTLTCRPAPPHAARSRRTGFARRRLSCRCGSCRRTA